MTKWFKKHALIRPLPFHPLLVAAYPVLFLYSFNIKEMSIGDVYSPLGVAVAGTAVLWLLLTLLLQHGRKSALATTVFVILFFSYGHLYDFLDNWNIFNIPHSRMIPAIVLIWAYFVYFLRFVRWDPRILTKALNLIGLVLVTVNGVRIITYQLSHTPDIEIVKVSSDSEITPVKDASTDLPDIYYFILDEYANNETMIRFFNYDNKQFIKGMEDRGFIFAHKSRTRSPYTPQIIAQILNMEYLTPGTFWSPDMEKYQTIPDSDFGPVVDPWSEETFKKIGSNKVVKFLQSRGYQYIYFGNNIEKGRWDRFIKQNADVYYNYYENNQQNVVTEFQNTLWNSTMLRPIYFQLVGDIYETFLRSGALNTLSHLERIATDKGPKFVFAHIILPHGPFIFGAQGEFITPLNNNNWADRQFYRNQYIFTSNRIMGIVDSLIQNSRSAPIIIIQSDHGVRCHHPGVNLPPEEGFKILNAIFLPGAGRDMLWDSISPVNTFRFIFNHYFGTNYDLLEDY